MIIEEFIDGNLLNYLTENRNNSSINELKNPEEALECYEDNNKYKIT